MKTVSFCAMMKSLKKGSLIMEKKLVGMGVVALMIGILASSSNRTDVQATKSETQNKTEKTAEVATVKHSMKKKTATEKKTETKKEEVNDTTAPVITVNNGEIIRGSAYDAKSYYSVTDDQTLSPDVTLEGNVDPNTEGDYTVTVLAKDRAGNQSTATYTITVTAPTCNGTDVTEACVLDGVRYNRYVYHPAVVEQSHMEQRSSQEQTITGYCTLCMDNTYSPSCATGRGACSHHGGVQQWNAPIYGTKTNTWEEKVIDVPAQDAYYETDIAQ